MSPTPISRQMQAIRYARPCYVPHDGVVYGIDTEYAENDPRHFWPSATCVPMHANLASAQASAEDISFMLSGYLEAMILLARVAQAGATADTLRAIKLLLLSDELHAFRHAKSAHEIGH